VSIATDVSTATMTEHHGVEPAESPLTPESWGKLGMWVFLAADAVTFGCLLAGYGALRYGDPTWPAPSSILGIPLTAFMTFLLICSSVTMVEGLAGIRGGNQGKCVRFLVATALGGAMFLGLQAYEWTHLIEHGQSITRNNFGATFFILTGFHGMHVFSGVVYLSVIAIRAALGKYGAAHNNEVEIAGLYWHFVDLIWILVFTFVYLI
jgi:cytochrome c oxidase subunit 3